MGKKREKIGRLEICRKNGENNWEKWRIGKRRKTEKN